MHLPDFLRRVNRVVTNPLLGTVAWLVPPLAVVHHVGRKSGRAYTSPVIAFRTPTGYVIPMTYGRDVDWAQNLLASGQGEVVQHGKTYPLKNPRIVHRTEDIPFPFKPILHAADLPGYVLLDDR